MAASVAVAIALVLEAGALVMRLPDGSVAKIITTSDSASAVAEKQPPPAWLERVAPGAAEQNRAMTPRRGSALATALKWWGTAAGLLLIGALYGSIGWAGAMLWGLDVRGVWDRPLQVRPT